MAKSVALVAVASPGLYTDLAEQMFETAAEFFMPQLADGELLFGLIDGDEGWPNGTMYRHHHLLGDFPDTDYVFLIDADMRFEAEVGKEILSEGITATFHPGYFDQPVSTLPFETRPESVCYVQEHMRLFYYCGGFIGGRNDAMRDLSTGIALLIDQDQANGITPVWHDESALNKILSLTGTSKNLSPAYCHPDNDAYYQTIWPIAFPRRIVALDKTAAERGGR